MTNKSEIRLGQSYQNLPETFYQKLSPLKYEDIKLRFWNNSLATKLGMSTQGWTSPELASLFSGSDPKLESTLLAQAYSGHQFGYFNPNLGDGRAALLGEYCDSEKRCRDIHLKGIGRTQYSRRGDGLANVSAVVKEYLIGESLWGLKIPTSRVLALMTTGSWVQREAVEPGAVMARVAQSHLRVGTFEYCVYRKDIDGLRSLTSYFIKKYHPDLAPDAEGCVELFRRIVDLQASLVARWISVGFVHGVLNTDNTFLSGESLDFGPCAFLEEYNPDQVFSRIDEGGRYAFSKQPQIVQWNLSKFGAALIMLHSELGESFKNSIRKELELFGDVFEKYHLENMGNKFGIQNATNQDVELMREYLEYLYLNKKDYTLGFRRLSDALLADSKTGSANGPVCGGLEIQNLPWFGKWKNRIFNQGLNALEICKSLDQVNPAVIARNHKVVGVIEHILETGDWSRLPDVGEILRNPFVETDQNKDWIEPASEDQKVTTTHCNT